jgi:hypothetical protein
MRSTHDNNPHVHNDGTTPWQTKAKNKKETRILLIKEKFITTYFVSHKIGGWFCSSRCGIEDNWPLFQSCKN